MPKSPPAWAAAPRNTSYTAWLFHDEVAGRRGLYTTSIVLGAPLTHHILRALLPAGDVAHQRLPQQPCEGEVGQEPVHRRHRLRPHCQLSGPACAVAQRYQQHQQPQGASATASAAAGGAVSRGVTSSGSGHQQWHVQYLSGARAAVAAAAGQSCCFAPACQLAVAILFGWWDGCWDGQAAELLLCTAVGRLSLADRSYTMCGGLLTAWARHRRWAHFAGSSHISCPFCVFVCGVTPRLQCVWCSSCDSRRLSNTPRCCMRLWTAGEAL